MSIILSRFNKECELWAPYQFWQMPDHMRREYKCGPGRGVLEKLVPDTWFIGWPLVRPLKITPACAIHDYMYEQGPSELWWKDQADRVFLNNMIRMIEAENSWFPVFILRMRKARVYYQAVKYFGGPSFWYGRNEQRELRDMCFV